jgi:hypothetical protein
MKRHFPKKVLKQLSHEQALRHKSDKDLVDIRYDVLHTNEKAKYLTRYYCSHSTQHTAHSTQHTAQHVRLLGLNLLLFSRGHRRIMTWIYSPLSHRWWSGHKIICSFHIGFCFLWPPDRRVSNPRDRDRDRDRGNQDHQRNGTTKDP